MYRDNAWALRVMDDDCDRCKANYWSCMCDEAILDLGKLIGDEGIYQFKQ